MNSRRLKTFTGTFGSSGGAEGGPLKGAAMIPVGGRQIFAATQSYLALAIKGRRDDGHDAPASETIAPGSGLMQRRFKASTAARVERPASSLIAGRRRSTRGRGALLGERAKLTTQLAVIWHDGANC